jgi:hypothetical protein
MNILKEDRTYTEQIRFHRIISPTIMIITPTNKAEYATIISVGKCLK